MYFIEWPLLLSLEHFILAPISKDHLNENCVVFVLVELHKIIILFTVLGLYLMSDRLYLLT